MAHKQDAGMMKSELGYYGLVVRPSFDDVLDASKRPLRIPMPDRAAKREAMSLYRTNLLEQQRAAMGYQLASMEHYVSDDTVPTALIHVAPSPSADDALFEAMQEQAQTHYENQLQAAMRHRWDQEAIAQMGHERRSNLSSIYLQGRGNAVLQGELPIEELVEKAVDTAAFGHQARMQVPRAAILNLPIAYGRGTFPELPCQRELNMGQARLTGSVGGGSVLKTGESYETMRSASGVGY